MLNHLPKTAKSKVQYEYWMRLGVVLMLLLGSVLLGVATLHAPSYVVIRNQIEQYRDSFAVASARTENLEAAEAKVSETNQLVTKVLENASTTPLLLYYQAIQQYTSNQVVVNGFSIQRDAETGEPGQLSINGVAATREALASFEDRLEADGNFAQAELPISSLASSQDIEFTMRLTPDVMEE